MAGVYSLIGMALLGLVTRTLLRERQGHRVVPNPFRLADWWFQ